MATLLIGSFCGKVGSFCDVNAGIRAVDFFGDCHLPEKARDFFEWAEREFCCVVGVHWFGLLEIR